MTDPRHPLPPITMTHEEFESMHARIEAVTMQQHYTAQALNRLIEVARDVVKYRDGKNEDTGEPVDLQDFITELEETIPCTDCMHAPCVCDNEPGEMR